MELVEASVVSVPANPNAMLMQCRSLGISTETQSLIFKSLTIGERIRRARRIARKARRAQDQAIKEGSADKIAILEKVIVQFEKEERELAPKPATSKREADRAKHLREVRDRALATIARIDRRIAAEEAASPLGQLRRQQAETIAAYEQMHADLDKRYAPKKHTPAFNVDDFTPTWRGQKIPPTTWRGKKV
jgi:hypothetical protein